MSLKHVEVLSDKSSESEATRDTVLVNQCIVTMSLSTNHGFDLPLRKVGCNIDETDNENNYESDSCNNNGSNDNDFGFRGMRNSKDDEHNCFSGNKCSNISNRSCNDDSESNDIPLFDRVILNDLIFHKIEGFLNDTNIDANNLLNVCKKFEIMKKEKFYWKLNRKYSAEYYHCSIFKIRLDSLLTSTRTQLSLTFKKTTDMGYYFDSEGVQIQKRYPEITDVNSLGNIHELDLSKCREVSDVSALGAVHILNISGCNRVTDVSALGTVYKLTLSSCTFIDNVNALGNVHELDLSNCRQISDISALGDVHILNISGCTSITDVSALGNVHELDLRRCKRITNVRALGKVHKLYLSECYDGREQ